MKLFTELPKYAAYCCRPSTIGLCVSLSQSWALQKRLNRSKYRLGCELGWALLPRNYILMAVQIPKRKGAYGGMDGPGHVRAVDILKATQQGAAPVRCGWRLECTRWGAHWRHLANTTEPSVCGGDAALCQMTLCTRCVAMWCVCTGCVPGGIALALCLGLLLGIAIAVLTVTTLCCSRRFL